MGLAWAMRLTMKDPFNPSNTVQIPPRRSQRPRHHLRNRKMQNRFPAATHLLPRPRRYRSQVGHFIVRDRGLFDAEWCGPEYLHWYGRRCGCGDELCGCVEGV